MKFETLLFHTRFREGAFESLKAVLALRPAGLRRVVLVYIVPREEVAFVPYGGYRKDEEERQRGEARRRFEEWRPTVERAGVECRLHVAEGEVNPKLLEIAGQEAADLVVTGRKARTTFERIYVGTHVLDLLRRCPVPVLMAKHAAPFRTEDGRVETRFNRHMFARPMLATDWSEPSARGLEAIRALAPVVEQALVAHVISRRLTHSAGPEAVAALEAESRRRLDDYCRRLGKADIAGTPLLGRGATAGEIQRLAREHDASLIVLGRTGKDWLQEYWLGGVSHRVAENAERPVMVVP